MGVIIFGKRYYGVVERDGGEHAATLFFHIDYVPLIPLGTAWVRAGMSGARQGSPAAAATYYQARRSGKSVAAAYLRTWGAGVAVISLAAMTPGGLVFGGVLAALSGWSWTWRSRRGSRERRRSDLNLAAFGLRFDPERMTDEHAAALQPAVEERWAAQADGRTPLDIARLGGTPEQLTAAYGVLALAARDPHAPHAAEARAAVIRLLDSLHDAAALAGGPYRAAQLAEPEDAPTAID